MAICQALEAYGVYRRDGTGELNKNRIRRAEAWLTDRSQRLFLSLVHGWLADICATAGDRDETIHWAGLARSDAARGDLLGAAMAYRAEARCAWGAGNLEMAERMLDRADSNAQQRGSIHELAQTNLLRGEVLLERRPTQAAAYLTQASQGFETLRMTAPEARARQMLQSA